MATLEQIADLYAGGNLFFKRVVGACLSAAWDIVNEDAGTENHANRLIWAEDVLGGVANAETRAKRIFGLVLSNATIQSSGDASTDNDIQFVVNSFINTVADGS